MNSSSLNTALLAADAPSASIAELPCGQCSHIDECSQTTTSSVTNITNECRCRCRRARARYDRAPRATQCEGRDGWEYTLSDTLSVSQSDSQSASQSVSGSSGTTSESLSSIESASGSVSISETSTSPPPTTPLASPSSTTQPSGDTTIPTLRPSNVTATSNFTTAAPARSRTETELRSLVDGRVSFPVTWILLGAVLGVLVIVVIWRGLRYVLLIVVMYCASPGTHDDDMVDRTVTETQQTTDNAEGDAASTHPAPNDGAGPSEDNATTAHPALNDAAGPLEGDAASAPHRMDDGAGPSEDNAATAHPAMDDGADPLEEDAPLEDAQAPPAVVPRSATPEPPAAGDEISIVTAMRRSQLEATPRNPLAGLPRSPSPG